MTTYYEAKILEVSENYAGSEVVQAYAIGATILQVYDVGGFDSDGGQLEIDEVTYTYLTTDDLNDTITLAAPGLTAAIDADEGVKSLPVTVEKEATIQVENEEPMLARVPHYLYDAVRVGIRVDDEREEVSVFNDGGDWVIHDIIGQELVRDGSFIDPTTIPVRVETENPPDSPSLSVVGLLESFILQTEAITPQEWLTFQISTNYDPANPGAATWSDLPNMPVQTTVMPAKRQPDGTMFSPDVDYSFRVYSSHDQARTLDAPPSAVVTRQLDRSAATLVAETLITNMVIAGFALLGQVNIGGNNFTLTPPGVDPDNPSGGLRILMSDGGLIHLPADGSPATFSGNVVANSLEIINGANISGLSRLNGEMKLTASVLDPTVLPSVINLYDSVSLPTTSPRGLCRNVANTGWVTTVGSEMVEYLDDGSFVRSVMAPSSSPAYGVTKVGSSYYLLVFNPAISWSIWVFNSSFVATNVFAPAVYVNADPEKATFGTDGTNLLFATEAPGAIFGSKEVRLYRLSTANGSFIDGTHIAATLGQLGGIYRGAADFGGDRWVVHRRSADARVYDLATPAVEQAGDTWPRPSSQDVRGLWWSGTNFWVIDPTGVVRMLENQNDAPAETTYWAYAWQDSDTHTTILSPTTTRTRLKRAKLRAMASPAPQETLAGTHVANRIAFYAAKTSGGTKFLQGSVLPIGTKSAKYVVIATSGTAAPAANNWAGVAPTGAFSATSNGFWVDGLSNGSLGTGTLRDDARANALVVAQPKTARGTIGSTVNAASKTVTISGYTLAAGDMLVLDLTNGNTSDAPTLSVNGGAAFPIVASHNYPAFDTMIGGFWWLFFTGSSFVLSGGVDPIDQIQQNRVTTGVATFGRELIHAAPTLVSQRLILSYFTAGRVLNVSQFRTVTGSFTPGGAAPTLCKMGLYQVNSDNSLTLLCSTANDTTLWAAAGTTYTRGVGSGSHTTIRGQRYAFAVLIDGTGTMPALIGQSPDGNVAITVPRLAGRVTGQTDLPASIASVTGIATERPWGVVL